MTKFATERRIRIALNDLASKQAPTQKQVTDRFRDVQALRSTGPASSDRSSSHLVWRRRDEAARVLAAAGVVAAIVILFGLDLGNSGSGDSLNNSPGTPIGQPTNEGIDDPVAVGRGRAVVSIPGGWSRSDIRCGVAQSDTVIFEFTGGRACYMRPSEFNTVTIGAAGAHEPAATTTQTRMDGADVFTSQARKQGGFTVIEVLVPREDAWFRISAGESDLAHAIADSVRLLSDDQTTMPDIYLGATGGQPGYSAAPGPEEVKRRLERADLALRARYVGEANSDQWSSLKADAEPGAVLPAGTEVTVTYSFGGKTK